MVVVLPLAAAMAMPACARNPATGERQLSFVSRDQEVALGRQAAGQVQQTIGVYPAPAVQAYVSRLGQRLAALSERPDLPWSFTVVDDPAVNAFALPGGFIYVTRGLLAYLGNEAQLASVLGHEIGHVTGKHAVERLSKAQLANVGFGLALLLSEEARALGQLGLAGLNLLFLKYSRDDEYQADQLGLRYAARANYALPEMADVFHVLARASAASGEGGRLPEWLSTHPYPENRIERARELIAEAAPAKVEGVVGRQIYLPLLEGLVFGDNPRNGFFAGNRYFHPELRFTVLLPADWQKMNLSRALVAQSSSGQSAFQLTVTPDRAPEEALRQFLAQPGVQVLAGVGARPAGLPAASAPFAVAGQTAAAGQGRLEGVVTFVRHGGRTFQLLVLDRAEGLASNRRLFASIIDTFEPVSDPEVLAVQPARLHLVEAPGRMTLADLHRQRGAPVSVESLARLNQMQPSTALSPGQTLKWVSGSPGAPSIAALSDARR